MASNSDDFDDFFDTSDPTAQDSNKPDQSRNKVSASPERDQSTDYSSDRDSRDDHADSHRRRNARSRSASSRSRVSSYSDDSRSRSSRRKGRGHSDSRSRSSGTEGSRSRTASSDSITGEEKEETVRRKAKVRRRRDSSISADAAECAKRHTKSKSRDDARDQAWNTEAKSRKSDGSDSNSSADRKSRRRRKDRRRSSAHSDSDITDVSPIPSPRKDRKERGNRCDAKPPKCLSRAPGVPGEASRGGDKSALELNLLMNAVSELEKQTRVQANTRTVMFEPSQIRREPKSNYTFSEGDTHKIDQENQRLLRQIMCRMQSLDGRYTGSTGKGRKSVMAASGINRLKDHHKIEKENLELLKRLQQIKPSQGISRHEQLSAYHTTLLHGVPISSTHCPPTPVSATGHHKGGGGGRLSSAGSEVGSLGSRTRSVTSVQSATTTASSSVRSGHSRRLRSRPSSAKSSVREKTPWDDRW